MILIDSHCHIDGEAFDGDRDEVVQRARDAGVDRGYPNRSDVAYTSAASVAAR